VEGYTAIQEDPMKRTSLVLAAFVLSAPLFAQEMMSSGPGAVATLKGSFGYVQDYIVRSAAEMPEADFAFKPTPEVRSFGQIIGHVADANYAFCSKVLGEDNPSPGVEKHKTSKADLQAALKASYDYCARAYSMPDKETGMKVKLFGMEMTRLGALLENVTHNWEHYGNLVTYLRIKGHVPPSSQPMKK
jgi:uncharacterized damage-inducible protein DinB